MRLFALSAVAALSACTPVTSAEQPAVPVDTPTGLNASDIAGEWRVAGVNGGEVNQSNGITASITDKTILINSGCVNMVYSYTLSNGTFSAALGQDVGGKPVMSCMRGLSDTENAIGDAIQKADTAKKDASNALVLSGGGTSLSLYTQ